MPERPNTGYQAWYSSRERTWRMAAAPPRSAASRHGSGRLSPIQVRTASATSSAWVSRSIGRRCSRSAPTSVTGRSAPLEPWLAPLLEGGEPLAEVLASRGQLEAEGLVSEVTVERRVGRGMHQPLGEP